AVALIVGARAITAVEGGDTNDLTSTSATLTFTVTADATTTAVGASPATTVYGQKETFTAKVIVKSPGAGTPTGTVTFKDGTTTLEPRSLVTGNGGTTAGWTTPGITQCA